MDQTGDTIRVSRIPTSMYETGRDVIQTQDSGFVITGFGGSANSHPFIIRTDPLGDTIFSRFYPNLHGLTPYSIRETPDKGLAFTAISNYPLTGFPIVKLDSLGDSLWVKYYAQGAVAHGNVIENTLDNGFIAVGSVNPSTAQIPFAIKTDHNGDSLWSHSYPTVNSEIGFYQDVEQLPDSGYILTGGVADSNYYINDLILTRLNKFGDTIWTKRYDIGAEESGLAVAAAPDGGFAVLLLEYNSPDSRLVKFNSSGDLLWTQTYPDAPSSYYGQGILSATSDSGFVFGTCQLVYISSAMHTYVIKTDSLGRVYPNMITGSVYWDADSNCIFGTSETELSQRVVHAENTTTGNHFYAITDNLGQYEIPTDTGVFLVSVDSSNIFSNWWEASPCASPVITHTLVGVNDTAMATFPSRPKVLCPFLDVDIGAWTSRRCSTNNYYLSYTNLGTATAYSPYIEVDIGPYATVSSASIPYSQPNGSTVVFQFDSLEINESGAIQLELYIDSTCTNTVVGEVYCVAAHIYPDSFCLPPDTNWSGASVAVTATCINDSVTRLAVYNEGSANMASSSHVIIVEDNILRLDTNVLLTAGDSVVWFKPANGSTWFIQANQSIGHPGSSHPAAFVEGCGQNSQGAFSLGYATGFPLDDANPFIDIHCIPLNGPYDPNEKVVSPAGRGMEHIIGPLQQLSYTLHFQNTGTASAYQVVVVDSLPPELNPGTIQSGASSHPYTFELLGAGIGRWTFANIQLPDSNTNEPGSHGFVQFTIDLDPNLPIQTRINNAVEIYFDFNLPIVTDTAFVTLGDNDDYIVVALDPMAENAPMKVFPNPFSNSTTILLSQSYPQVKMEVFDLQGRLLKHQEVFQTDRFLLSADDWVAGTYIFRVTSQGREIGSGRLSVHR